MKNATSVQQRSRLHTTIHAPKIEPVVSKTVLKKQETLCNKIGLKKKAGSTTRKKGKCMI